MSVSVNVIKNGITYDIEDFGFALLKHNIPPNPEKQDYVFEVPGRAGKVRMGTSYKERTFNLECILMADDATIDYQIKVANISELLDSTNGPQYWIFGDLPGKRFTAEYTGVETIDKMIFDGNLTIPMVAYFPFTETITDVSAGWSYGQGYTYGMGMRYGDIYTYGVTSSPSNFKIYHAGNVLLPPKITITGQFTNLSLSDGLGNTLVITRVNGALDVIVIDCENSTVTLNGANAYSQTNGVFFTLPKGETTYTATATGTINFTISFSPMRYRYTY